MPRRAVLALLVAVAGVAAAVAAVALTSGDGERRPARPAGAAAAPRLPDLGDCRRLGADAARECYTAAFTEFVAGRDDPRAAVAAIADGAWKEGPALVGDCHGIMHTVGREYARGAGVTLANLMDHLPQANDPGCTAGFAHGMVTAIAPDLDPERPEEAARVCADAGTRYREYSCVHGFGHAFMRLYGDQLPPALELCRGLGERSAADCAQGAYHDYWFAVAGADDARLSEPPVRDPRALCAEAPETFVRPCWYRAWVENRPATFDVRAPEDLDALCHELTGLQRAACISGAAVIGPMRPAAQLAMCARLPADADAAACVRGTKVQHLLGRPPATLVALADRCERFRAAVRDACSRWLGTALTVLTDGAFVRDGCPRLRTARARRACATGAAASDGALATFS